MAREADREGRDRRGAGAGADWFAQNPPPMPTGPVTSDDDPRISDPVHGNDPEVLAWLNRRGGPGDPGPVNGDYRSWFMGLTKGRAPTPTELRNLEGILKQYGVTLAPNAAGVVSKIKLPSGEIVDVIQNASTGGSAWQWLLGGGGGATTPPPVSTFSQAPTPYVSAPYPGGEYAPPPLPTELQTPFRPPTQAELEASPGYGARLAAGRQGRERGFAARGTIFSGGALKALERYAQDFASNEYSNLYGQNLTTRNQTYGEYQGAVGVGNQTYANRYNAWQGENSRTLTDYITNLGARRNWELDRWGMYKDLYQGGLQANL